MNLGTLKWKKARANFARVRDDAGRCGAACTRACLWDAHRMQQPRPRQAPMSMLPRPGHAPAKGHRQPPWAGSQGHGMLACMLPRPRPWQPQCASSQGQGTQPRPWHACVGTLPCTQQGPWGHAARPLGARSKAPGGTQPEGQPPHGEAVACPWDL